MAASFAAALTRLNASVLARLATHTAIVNGEWELPVIFRAAPAEAIGVLTTRPVVHFESGNWPGAAAGDAIEIDGVHYVFATVRTDAYNMTMAELQRV